MNRLPSILFFFASLANATCSDQAAATAISHDPGLQAYIRRWDIDIGWVNQKLDELQARSGDFDFALLEEQAHALLDDYRRWNRPDLDAGVRVAEEFPGGKLPMVLQAPYSEVAVTINSAAARAARALVFNSLEERVARMLTTARAAETAP